MSGKVSMGQGRGMVRYDRLPSTHSVFVILALEMALSEQLEDLAVFQILVGWR
jgi:hypothetical protein